MTLVEAVREGRMWHARHLALRWGGALIAIGFAIAIAMFFTRPDFVSQSIDDTWAGWMESARTPWAVRLAEVFSVLGGSRGTLPARILVVVLLVARKRWVPLWAFGAGTLMAELCIGPIKHLVERARPVGGLVATSGSSFPSGHAIAGAVTAFGLVVALCAPGPRRYVWIAVASVFAALMAWSRTYLGVHWFTDVFAGTCLGVGSALFWPAAIESWRDRRAHHVVVADEAMV